MGAKLAKGNCKLLSHEDQFIRKIEWRRKQNQQQNNYFPTAESYRELVQVLNEIIDYTFEDMATSIPVKFMREQIRQFTSKEWSSMVSYLVWENEFREVMQNEVNELFNGEFESKRTAQFMKIQNNVLTTLLNAFDFGIIVTYEKKVGEWLKMTCHKYDNIGYKKKTPQKMIMFISSLEVAEISPLEDPEQIKQCRVTLKEILTLVKRLGQCMAMFIQVLESGKIGSTKKTEHISTALTINCFLKYNFSFYVMSMFMARVLLLKDVNTYIVKKRILLKQNRIFEDLVYLNQFITNEKDQKTLRDLTRKNMGEVVNDENTYNYLYAQINQKKMEMDEFLGHVNHHLKLNLDHIFFANLSDIMYFFNRIEDFMDKIFKNAELEIKIDLIRVIFRINDSTDFFYKIYLITLMDIEFLTSCQIFALFNQVLLCSELKVKCRV